MHNLTNEELIAENTALKAKISALDKQDPDGYTVTFYEDTRGGDRKRITQYSIEPHLPNIPLGVNNVEFRELISAIPLFTRPPITSERELELLADIAEANGDYDNISAELTRVHSIANEKVDSLLAVIKQMREALTDLTGVCITQVGADYNDVIHAAYKKGLDALALTTDLSALKEHDVDGKRYRYLRTHATFNSDICKLDWYLPRVFHTDLSPAERLDAHIDADIRRIAEEQRKP